MKYILCEAHCTLLLYESARALYLGHMDYMESTSVEHRNEYAFTLPEFHASLIFNCFATALRISRSLFQGRHDTIAE